jgi:hypothetical protein
VRYVSAFWSRPGAADQVATMTMTVRYLAVTVAPQSARTVEACTARVEVRAAHKVPAVLAARQVARQVAKARRDGQENLVTAATAATVGSILTAMVPTTSVAAAVVAAEAVATTAEAVAAEAVAFTFTDSQALVAVAGRPTLSRAPTHSEVGEAGKRRQVTASLSSIGSKMQRFNICAPAISLCVAVAIAGCGGSQPPIAPGALPQAPTITTPTDQRGSWMLPEANGQDLLYISDYYGVHMYSYPKGQYVGDIGAFGYGLCSDRAGDVFVTDELVYQVYEYAHGGTERLKTLYDNYIDFGPVDCAVDPTTGNLAVSSADSSDVVVFTKAQEQPQVYYESMFGATIDMYRCAYDNKGDLFVDQVAKNGHQYIGELPKGATTFTNYLLDPRIAHAGGIQFDGKHVAIEDQGSLIVYRLRFSGSNAIVVDTTPLNGAKYLYQYWIRGKTLIGPDEYGNVYFWQYPVGGSPVSSIQGFTEPYGSTVSVGH